MYTFTLADKWALMPVDKFLQGNYLSEDGAWLPTNVPNHWQQHPELTQYAGKVVYRCQFKLISLPSLADSLPKRVWLRVNGAFYWSQPFLNGHDLGLQEGYFIPSETEITHELKRENTLFVEVNCPNEQNKTTKQMLTGVLNWLDSATNPGGLWQPVELHYSGPVRLQSVRCHPEAFNEQFAQLAYTAKLDAISATKGLFRWTIAPKNFAGQIQTVEQWRNLSFGVQEIKGLFKLRDPQLWWTHDLGDPNLYTITLEIVLENQISDYTSFDFGIRRFELRNWIPYLNSVRFLAKGSNYGPGDLRLATMTPARYAQDLQLARDCHMNFLRVHAHLEQPAFYAAADEMGLLLCQDLPLQGTYQRKILPEAKRQAQAMVHLLYNHPSVAVWAMHDKPVSLLETADKNILQRLRIYSNVFFYNWNRDIMDSQLKKLAAKEDSSRPVIRSSGEFRVPGLRQGTDSHAYFGWFNGYGTLEESEKWRKQTSFLRFVTEFGAQSFPNLENCLKFMPNELKKVDFADLARNHGFQAAAMRKWYDWRAAASLEALVEMSQNYQSEINRFYIDRLRYHKYRPTGGILAFNFIDSFPAISWGIIDFWRIPKRSYAAMRGAFSPQYAFTLILPRKHQVAIPIDLPIYAVNDAQHRVSNLRLQAHLLSPLGEEIATVKHEISLEADCLAQEIDRLRFTPSEPGCYRFKIELLGLKEEIAQEYKINVG